MVSQRTLQTVQAAADRYDQAEQESLPLWQWSCDCEQPGTRLACRDCVGFKLFVKTIQQKVEVPKSTALAMLAEPDVKAPFSAKTREDSLALYLHGLSFEEIREYTGVQNLRVLRRWVSEAGLTLPSKEYTDEQRAVCLNLYKQGLAPAEVEDKTRIPAYHVSDWAIKAGISRSKRTYTQEEKNTCLRMYLEGKSRVTIANQTGIPDRTIKDWIEESNLHRPRIKPIKGRPRKHSDEVRERCLKRVAEGQKPSQIELVEDVSADTIRRWWKEAKEVDEEASD